MYSNDEFISIIKRRLSESRFVHSMNVAKAAADLAKKYGADEEKAYTAGILHDIMKEESLDIQYEYISRNNEIMTVLERSKSQVVHQMSGAAYCRIELGIDDHTTGKRDMTLLQKIVYTADFISAERSYPDVEIMREKAHNSLEEAMLYSLKYTINDLASKAMLIHPDTLECYNSILENFMEKE